MAGGFEGENPTRRYKWFRPRQAARGSIAHSFDGGSSTCGLFNNSNGTHVLVVRALVMAPTDASVPRNGIAYLQGMPGTVAGVVTPLYPGSGTLPGQMWYVNDGRITTPDFCPVQNGYSEAEGYWPYDFPIAILPPGWSLITADANGENRMMLSAVWEAIYPEELDWLY